METTRIQNSQTEQIRVTALNTSFAFVTGLTDVLVEIRRESDGYYFDFNDTTFKNSGWTTRQQQMAELDVTNSAGTYYYNFDTTGLSDDNYFIRVSSATANNSPWEGELKVGDYIDNIDASVSSRASETNATSNKSAIIVEIDANETKLDTIIVDTNEIQTKLPTNNIMGSSVKTDKDDEIDAIKAKTDNLPADPASETNVNANETKIDLLQTDLTQILADIAGLNNLAIADVQTALTNQGYNTVRAGYLDNLIKILGLTQSNFRLSNIVFDANGSMTSATKTIYPTALDTTNQTNAITSYTITATHNVSDELTSYKVTED